MAELQHARRPLPPRRDQATRVAPTPPARQQRPDPRPMRVVYYGAASVAALSVLTVGLSHPASHSDAEVAFDTTVATPPTDAPPTDAPATTQLVDVQHLINYVQLQPGQTPPPGAKVITADAPAPRIVVTTVAAPVVRAPAAPRTTSSPPTKKVRTRQSGTP